MRIKEQCKKKNITITELANKAKISRSYLYEINEDKKNPSLQTLKKISECLNVKIDELI